MLDRPFKILSRLDKAQTLSINRVDSGKWKLVINRSTTLELITRIDERSGYHLSKLAISPSWACAHSAKARVAVVPTEMTLLPRALVWQIMSTAVLQGRHTIHCA